MHDTAPSVITAWSNFYVITGSSAAALTGLMFVVITLVAGDRTRTTHEGVATFSTPTVMHFCAALLVSAILSAPWLSLTHVAAVLGLVGLCGVVYVTRVLQRTRRLTEYRPGIDDWVWFAILPSIAYVAILAAAILLPSVPTQALFALAGANLLLIFIGIHNAWDVVTYIAIQLPEEPSSPSTSEEQRTSALREPS
ncbi:MAG: hypothetical protein JWN27_1658 [Candidatus Eremiobacteraeota bacterium]|nr:hypothetical protein [Candidatus Eremiobacteraeota bacterium]